MNLIDCPQAVLSHRFRTVVIIYLIQFNLLDVVIIYIIYLTLLEN